MGRSERIHPASSLTGVRGRSPSLGAVGASESGQIPNGQATTTVGCQELFPSNHPSTKIALKGDSSSWIVNRLSSEFLERLLGNVFGIVEDVAN